MARTRKKDVQPTPEKIRTIAFVTDAIYSASFIQMIISGVAKYMQHRRRFSLQYVPFEEVKKADIANGFDGIITNMCAPKTRGLLDMLKGTDIPIVDTGAEIEDPAAIRVDIDIVKIGTMAAQWFLQRRFRNFAYCGHHGKSQYIFSDVLENAFASEVEKAGCRCLTYDEPLIAKRHKLRKRNKTLLALDAMEAWIKELPRRTAVLCVNDHKAALLLRACMKLGRSVPDDIAIMGQYNNVSSCICTPVPITSIDVNLRGQGYAAMRILAEAIEKPAPPKLRPVFRVQPLGIVERDSTNVYPIDPPYLAKALLRLDENLNRLVTIPELAQMVGVPPTTLRAAFKRVLGTSLGKYALALRMREAKRLIDEGLHSIKEVATRTGFTSQSLFCHNYSAHFGHPPSRLSR